MKLYRAKNFTEAAKHFAAATAADPNHAKARYNLACVHALLGDASSAVRDLESLVALGGPESVSRLEKLRTDPDFNSIRESPVFRQFIQTHMPPDETVNAEEILAAYRTSAVEAMSRFGGRSLVVVGYVGPRNYARKADGGSVLELLSEEPGSRLSARLSTALSDAEQLKTVESLTMGQSVRLRCVGGVVAGPEVVGCNLAAESTGTQTPEATSTPKKTAIDPKDARGICVTVCNPETHGVPLSSINPWGDAQYVAKGKIPVWLGRASSTYKDCLLEEGGSEEAAIYLAKSAFLPCLQRALEACVDACVAGMVSVAPE
jgi:hypothetical protein